LILAKQHYLFRITTKSKDYAGLLTAQELALNDATTHAFLTLAYKLVLNRVILEVTLRRWHSQVSIQQIADQLSFKDPAYFSRCFKKHTGFSPVASRNASGNRYTESSKTSLVQPNQVKEIYFN
jgi:AraC-like DNA-binding protein